MWKFGTSIFIQLKNGGENMGKECRTCVFNTKKESCKILNERIEKDCWAWADEKEYRKRKADIEAYKARYEVDISKFDTIKERLDGSFMELYEQNLNDTQIAKSLNLNQNTVGNYRRKLGLENNYRKKSLRQQANKK
jgi:hypothetical protein